MDYQVLKGKKVALLSLGCKVNSYETDAIREQFIGAGSIITDFEEAADVYIINTCSVTNIADRKSRQMLRRARQNNGQALIVATGCYAQAGQAELLEAGIADVVAGNNHKGEILERVALLLTEMENEACLCDDISAEKSYENMSISECSDRSRAFVKIEDGCNQFCSYCFIPYARGRVRSRDLKSIVEEVKALAAKGIREVVLTGIHLSSYGNANYEENARIEKFNHGPLLEVIEEVNGIDGIERIRLGSLEPRIISDEFAAKLAAMPKFCPHFHLSLQSGCESVLKRMNRHYTPEEFYDICEILRRHFDNPAITTDVITGFPGETEEEFAQGLEFLKKVCFAKMHVFKYSRRKGTVADRMPAQITEQIKHERSEKVIALDSINHINYAKQFVGARESILVERITKAQDGYEAIGLTSRYVEVTVALNCDSEKENLIGRIINTDIVSANEEGMLFGKQV